MGRHAPAEDSDSGDAARPIATPGGPVPARGGSVDPGNPGDPGDWADEAGVGTGSALDFFESEPDPDAARFRSRRRRVARATGWWVAVLAVVLLLAYGVRAVAIQSYWIPSSSMEPTLHGCEDCQDDRVLVDKLSYRFGDIRSGDIVVFRAPASSGRSGDLLIKRVVAVGGQTISARGGKVIVDSALLTESYVNPDCDGTSDFGPVPVPDRAIFVMGDNRCDSLDSRVFGSVADSAVVGRAFIVIWPLQRLKRL